MTTTVVNLFKEAGVGRKDSVTTEFGIIFFAPEYATVIFFLSQKDADQAYEQCSQGPKMKAIKLYSSKGGA